MSERAHASVFQVEILIRYSALLKKKIIFSKQLQMKMLSKLFGFFHANQVRVPEKLDKLFF
jgi:hypothetical protein